MALLYTPTDSLMNHCMALHIIAYANFFFLFLDAIRAAGSLIDRCGLQV